MCGSILSNVFAQCYPVWFLEQGNLKFKSIIGFTEIPFYTDSSFASAVENGQSNLSKNRSIKIKGGQGFLTTEAGSIWMGSDIKESYDTSGYKNPLVIIDTAVCNNLLIALLAEKFYQIDDILKEYRCVDEIQKPGWVEQPPENSNFLYSIGRSKKYYYEQSSWDEAEKNARLNLARRLNINVKSLQKFSSYYSENIESEELKITLKEIEIIQRWRDPEQHFFYVLIRIPHPNFY